MMASLLSSPASLSYSSSSRSFLVTDFGHRSTVFVPYAASASAISFAHPPSSHSRCNLVESLKFKNGRPSVALVLTNGEDNFVPSFLASSRLPNRGSRDDLRILIFSGMANPALSQVGLIEVQAVLFLADSDYWFDLIVSELPEASEVV